MQPGVLRRSQLLDSLKVYLNNKGRLQPIIGLGSITECVKAGTQSREALYLCEVCVSRLSKADMRNHILGSLHRFSYIKTWHPHLMSKWQESSDLSKLAWPLMEMAKMLEEKEGPGDIQLLEVEDDVYQRIATHHENDAVELINSLRDTQGETESYSKTTALHYPTESQRTVLLAQNQSRWSKKSLMAEIDLYKTSVRTNKPPPLIRANADPSVKSVVCLVNPFTSQLDNPEPSVLLKISRSFLDGYTGTDPLIGLDYVVECRSEGGCSYCFLCHCCRIRSNKKDIIDHLTSSSHLINCLMETHPKEVEDGTADFKDKSQLLQSLAKKVEQEKGRGELKVVRVPETLCMLLTGKSYHWCIKMLQGGWKHTNIQKKRIAVNGPSVNQMSAGGMPQKCALMESKRAKRVKAKRKTVFNVSLPLTKGSVLLKRMSFSRDNLPVSATSPPFDLDLMSSPESEIVDCELDSDSSSCEFDHTETSPLQHDLCNGDADAAEYIPEGNFIVAQFQQLDGYVADGVHFYQSEDLKGKNGHKVYWKRRDSRHHGDQVRSSKTFYKMWKNEETRTQNEALLPAVCHTVSSYNSSYRHGEGQTEQGYSSASENGLRGERHKGLSSDAGQQYNQRFQNPYIACDNRDLHSGSVGGYHDLSGNLAPYLNGARINIQTHLVDAYVYSGSISPYSELTSGHVQEAPQNYGTQSTAYQASQGGRGWMSYPSHNTGPSTNPDQHFLPPAWSSGSDWSLTHSAFSKPHQPQCAGPHTDLYSS